jgi:hypothetical protein
MVYRNSEPGLTPKTFAPLMRGISGAGGSFRGKNQLPRRFALGCKKALM